MYLNDVCECADQRGFEQDPKLSQNKTGLYRDIELVGKAFAPMGSIIHVVF